MICIFFLYSFMNSWDFTNLIIWCYKTINSYNVLGCLGVIFVLEMSSFLDFKFQSGRQKYPNFYFTHLCSKYVNIDKGEKQVNNRICQSYFTCIIYITSEIYLVNIFVAYLEKIKNTNVKENSFFRKLYE